MNVRTRSRTCQSRVGGGAGVTSRYGRPLEFGLSIVPASADIDLARARSSRGAGSFWEAIRAMGGPVRSGREALEALEEAIRVIRAFRSGERTISVVGKHYSVRGLHPGPSPAHPIEIWLGVGKLRALALTKRGRLPCGPGIAPRARRFSGLACGPPDRSTR